MIQRDNLMLDSATKMAQVQQRMKKKAIEWYSKSAEGGYSNDRFNVGFCYRHGIGIAKDEKKAFECI